ncbi:hypothetical protein [Siphonobacter sp. SORGH_AS_0500]|uniref:hypothetical protein n=1 Tax=Siphonobacter sp. SORGH_AS_0500 TaxID=1864824 RepID=UPI000CBBC704|nr:hypothetical protein [Siphonobacter sp. SORGH_AS_0500]MDR6195156.1 hypothetical protein [Siphonobacter sp. SORGH_AS_0500]PKK38331.1 hypothetical protein BWI96_00650 [Siphonobacter sp. SORGH_AS_0500]
MTTSPTTQTALPAYFEQKYNQAFKDLLNRQSLSSELDSHLDETISLHSLHPVNITQTPKIEPAHTTTMKVRSTYGTVQEFEVPHYKVTYSCSGDPELLVSIPSDTSLNPDAVFLNTKNRHLGFVIPLETEDESLAKSQIDEYFMDAFKNILHINFQIEAYNQSLRARLKRDLANWKNKHKKPVIND